MKSGFPRKNRNLLSIKTHTLAIVMHKLLIIKTVVCQDKFRHIADLLAYIFKSLIQINFENILIDNDI